MADAPTELVIAAARLIRQVRRELDLPAYVRVLALLDELGPIGISQLAAADNCAQPTMSTQVRSMHAEGLVDRVPHPDDARSSLISLSTVGRARLADVRTRLGSAIADRLATNPAADIEAALRVLRSLVD